MEYVELTIDVNTGVETKTSRPYTAEELAAIDAYNARKLAEENPTIEQLQAQLADIAAKLQALQGA